MEKAAIEYGDGLYALAKEEGLTDQIRKEAKALRKIFLENPEYISLLTSKKLEDGERSKLMEESFSGRLHPYLYNFLLLLADRGYFPYVTSCLYRYEACYLKDNNILKVKVSSAGVLPEEAKSRIVFGLEQKLGGKVEPEWFVDPSLLAGIRVEADGLLIENSAKQRIEDLKRLLGASVT